MVNHRQNHNQLHVRYRTATVHPVPAVSSNPGLEWSRRRLVSISHAQSDDYLSPEVRYTAFPPTTNVKLGGRYMEVDRAVDLKIRLLERDEDFHFWCNKKQHSQRINCGEYHKDFSDVEVGYSFSSPQTHIWFGGYAIHAECFENLFFSSHSATVRVTPEHVIPKHVFAGPMIDGLNSPPPQQISLADLQPTRSLFEMVIEEGADFPIYTAAVPKRVPTEGGYVTRMVPTAEFVNDCERTIIRRDAFDVGAAVTQTSDPVSYPPTFPPVKPFENAGLFWSFVYNRILEMRLEKDDLEQAFKDLVLINRFKQYSSEARAQDKMYLKALDRLAHLFATHEAMHKATWPLAEAKCGEDRCTCVVCKQRNRHLTRLRPQMRTGRESPKRARAPKFRSRKQERESSVMNQGVCEEAQDAGKRLADVWKKKCVLSDVAQDSSKPQSPEGSLLYFYTGGIRPR